MPDLQDAIRFDGLVAVVVGAGPGLGATLARRFAAAGGGVAAVARSAKSLAAVEASVREVGVDALTIAADVGSPSDMRRMADTVMERFGRVDVLVNTAFGVGPKLALLDMDTDALERWRRNVEIGGYGTLLASRYIAPFMVANGRGAIVNITSMSSRIGMAGRSDYAAGKAQGHKIAHVLAAELGPSGIRVNCVAPGHIWSDNLKGFYAMLADKRGVDYETVLAEYTEEMALRRIVTADEIANAVLFLASDLASGITGALIDVNAGHLFTP